MNRLTVLTVSCVAVAAGWIPSAIADSAKATCQVHKEGEMKPEASGPCSFSQRQGYIDITLRDGETYSLSPADEPDHFTDQKGHQVVRTKAEGNSHTYRWEQKRIVVTFGS